MSKEPLSTQTEHPEFARLIQHVSSGRYFRRLSPQILASVLKQGSLQSLEKDAYLIREGDDSPPEMFILVEGSLVIMANGKFILRLDQPGDVVGEMSVIQSVPRSADVVAESSCRVIVFPAELFEVAPTSRQASILYVLFSHILAAKLRITTAQSLIYKNRRVAAGNKIKVAVIDANEKDRSMVVSAVSDCWSGAQIFEHDDPGKISEYSGTQRLDLIIADINFFGDMRRDWNWTSTLIKDLRLRGAHIVILSESCHKPDDRELLIKMGVDDLMTKPCTPLELKHVISRVQTWHYKNLELDKAETEAETDELTGLANRRRLDQFIDALATVYPDEKKPFSLIMTDIDNFKHYNDSNGHQMGDIVLKEVATLMVAKVRRSDLAARFGGEEFLIVLPDCGKAKALEVAETLRKAVESAVFPFQDKQPGGSLTTTLGVATFPEDATDLKTLLKKADDCLYEGKRQGKNIVISAMPHEPEEAVFDAG